MSCVLFTTDLQLINALCRSLIGVENTGSRLNWGAFTEEANTIYVSVKKLSFYLADASISLGGDYLP